MNTVQEPRERRRASSIARVVFLGTAGAFALSACHSAMTRMYTLAPSPAAAKAPAYPSAPLRVDHLNVPASWDRIEILTPAAPGQLHISDFDHWSAPLTQMARQTLSADLDLRMPPGGLVYPRLPKPPGAFGVDVDILQFDMLGSQAAIRASWVIQGPNGAQDAMRSAATLQVDMAGEQPSDIAQAWSKLLGQLADRIAVEAGSPK